MKRIGRDVHAWMKKMSTKLARLPISSAGPSSGRFSTPNLRRRYSVQSSVRMRNRRRNCGMM